MTDLRARILETDALPTISSVASQLLSLPLETDKGERELLNLIESDPFIAARVIGMANSPLFSPSRKVCTVRDAALVLGLSRVKSIALAIALMGPVRMRKSTVFSLRDLWLHSFSMATGMRTLSGMLSPESRPSEEMLFLSGLLHDLGYLALAYLVPERFDAFLERMESSPGESVLEAESTEFGITHSEIGGMLARSWNLPEEVVGVIEGHHEADAGNTLLILARLIESITGEGAIRMTSSRQISGDELEAIGLDPRHLADAKEMLEMQQEQIILLADMLTS
ncbi:MAG TPA: HDOD domain-containing protein [Burkholderiales bacterium]|nr:HDOD domain-containing protein [Burkholderiales bacterium]